MKNFIIIIIVALLNGEIYAQDSLYNFSLSQEQISWQKVYETSLDIETLTKEILSSGVLGDYEIVNGSIIGSLKDFIPDFKGVGYKLTTVASYITQSYFTGTVIIDFKEGKYKIAIKNIGYNQKEVFGSPYLPLEEVYERLEKPALDKNGFYSRNFRSKPSHILDYTFNNFFTVRPKKDDW
jgi:hypothetical protein